MAVGIFELQPGESRAQRAGRWLLGGAMVLAGISHLTFARRAFRAQVPQFVPKWTPLTVDEVVVWSGVAEIAVGASLILLAHQRRIVGSVLGVFYVAILPGNIAQWKHDRNAFGLDTEAKRFWRLFAQPFPMAWALWSTGALAQESKK